LKGKLDIPSTLDISIHFGEKQDLGLKCSAWKVFGSKDFGLVGLYQNSKLNIFG